MQALIDFAEQAVSLPVWQITATVLITMGALLLGTRVSSWSSPRPRRLGSPVRTASLPQVFEQPNPQGFAGWAVLELMGHRTRGGFVQEVELAGTKFLQVKIPIGREVPADGVTTWGPSQYYRPDAVYALTPTSEEQARRTACSFTPDAALPAASQQSLPRPAATSREDRQDTYCERDDLDDEEYYH